MKDKHEDEKPSEQERFPVRGLDFILPVDIDDHVGHAVVDLVAEQHDAEYAQAEVKHEHKNQGKFDRHQTSFIRFLLQRAAYWEQVLGEVDSHERATDCFHQLVEVSVFRRELQFFEGVRLSLGEQARFECCQLDKFNHCKQ